MKMKESNSEKQNIFFSYLQPNPNQVQRYKQELEGRKKKIKRNLQKIELGLDKINKTYENKEWEGEIEKLFLNFFYKSEIDMAFLEKFSANILIIKNKNFCSYYFFNLSKFSICDYKIRKAFSRKFHLTNIEIKQFLKVMLKKYFKLNKNFEFIFFG